MDKIRNRVLLEKGYETIEGSTSGITENIEGKKEVYQVEADGVYNASNLSPDICPPEEEKEKEEEKIPAVGILTLFRYSSAFDKFLMTVAVFAAIVSGASMPSVSIVYGKVLNQLVNYEKGSNTTNSTIPKEDFLAETAYLSMLNAIFGLSYFLCNYIAVSCLSLAAANQALRIRCLFMQSVLKQDIGWFDTNKTGDFASRITGDLNRIQDGIGEKIGICISYISTSIFCGAIGMYYGWKLALVVLSISPVLTISLAIMSKLQATVVKEELQAYGMAGAVAEEVLSAIRTVVAYGGEKKEIQRYDNCLIPARKKGIKRGLMTSIGSGLTWFCIFAGYALAFWYGVKLIVQSQENGDDKYNAGVMTTVVFTILQGSMFIGQTAPHLEAFALARGAAAKIYSIIERQPTIDSSSTSGKKPDTLEGYIKFEDVSFSYPSRPTVPILKGLSLDVKKGETVALVGSSGCGKSTVIQLILRFYDTSAGNVELDGNNVKDLNVGWLRNHIGLVGQEPVLFSTTIEENIKLGKLNSTLDEVIKAAKLANVHDFIDSLPLKYKTLVGERGTQLSGGQKQRIAIARALVKNPRILLLDEATSALDTESEAVVQKALDKASSGRTTVVVAHRLSTIRNADKIIVLSEGVVHEIGTHDELMEKKGMYYRLVKAQAKEFEDIDEEQEEIEEYPVEIQRAISVKSTTGDGSASYGIFQRQISAVSPTLDRQISSLSGHADLCQEEEEEMEAKTSASQKRLYNLFAPEWPFALVGGIAALIMGVHFPVYGVLFGDLFGVLSKETAVIEKESNLYSLLFFLMSITAFISSFLQTLMLSIAGERLTSRLRKLVFANLVNQDITFFDHPKNSVGSLCSRLTSDASSVQSATGSRISTLIQTLSTMVASIVIGLIYNYKIGLVIFCFVPLVFLAAFLEGKIIRGQAESENFASEEAAKVSVEAIQSIRTVAALHQEDTFYIIFHDALLKPHKSSWLKANVRGLAYAFGPCLAIFANATAFYYGSRLVASGELTYSELLKVMQSVILGMTSVGQSIAFAPDYQKAKIAAVRIFKLLDLKPQIDAFSDQGIIMKSIKGDVHFRKVHFNYPSRPNVKVLRGLEMDVEPGKTVALVGSSGCGKSTCIQLIERFYDTQRGEVLIDGEVVKDLNVAKHRAHLGIVSQEPTLFGYSIAENIAYGDNSRTVDMSEIIAAARQANIHNFITSLPQGYETPVGDKGAQLSGGQKQRVAIARALLRNPKLLLLDEATSALDAESEKVVQDALDKARSGRTCLIIAHRLSTIQNADVIMVIHKGRIVEKGTHQELLNKRGHYFNLHNTQATNR